MWCVLCLQPWRHTTPEKFFLNLLSSPTTGTICNCTSTATNDSIIASNANQCQQTFALSITLTLSITHCVFHCCAFRIVAFHNNHLQSITVPRVPTIPWPQEQCVGTVFPTTPLLPPHHCQPHCQHDHPACHRVAHASPCFSVHSLLSLPSRFGCQVWST